MPAKRPTGARSETVECEHCGEHYAIIYKRCPFCDGRPTRRREISDDEPTLIFRRPTRQEIDAHAREESSRRPRRSEDEYDTPPRRLRRDEPEDEYEDDPMRRFVPERSYDAQEKDQYDDGYEDEEDSRPVGRRLVDSPREDGHRRRGPSIARIIGGILSIALIVAAGYIVVLIVKPFLAQRDPSPSGVTETVSPSPSSTLPPEPTPTPSGGEAQPSPSSEPQPTAPTAIPADQTANGFTLTDRAGTRKQDITLRAEDSAFTFTVSFSPAGSTGSITWSSSKPEIVSVDQSGKVTAHAKGVATVTATMAGGYAQSCIVRSDVGSAPSPSTPASPSPSPSASPSPSSSPSPSGGTLSFNVASGNDFTLSGVGDSWPLQVKNAVGTPTWSVKDSSIATVDQNGRVTAVAKGITTVTATVDGRTLECTVRVSIP